MVDWSPTIIISTETSSKGFNEHNRAVWLPGIVLHHLKDKQTSTPHETQTPYWSRAMIKSARITKASPQPHFMWCARRISIVQMTCSQFMGREYVRQNVSSESALLLLITMMHSQLTRYQVRACPLEVLFGCPMTKSLDKVPHQTVIQSSKIGETNFIVA